MTRTGATLVSCLIALALSPASSDGRERSRDGRIAWSRSSLDSSMVQIVSARPDGGDLRVLTEPPLGAQDLDPKWSPDSSRIVFERDLPDGRVQVVTVGADGGAEQVVDTGCSDPCFGDISPAWTPDGRHLVFTRVVGPFDLVNDSARSAALWIARDDGTGARRLSEPGIDGAYEDVHAQWAPDRSYIAFLRIRNADVTSAVFRMRPDGSGARQLTPWEIDADMPDLSHAVRGPSKDLVVFETFGHGGQSQNLATVPATCAALAICTKRIRYLTANAPDGATNSANPAWAPDGSHIAFSEWTVPEDRSTGDWFADIFTFDPDGRRRQLVSQGPEWSMRPNWTASR